MHGYTCAPWSPDGSQLAGGLLGRQRQHCLPAAPEAVPVQRDSLAAQAAPRGSYVVHGLSVGPLSRLPLPCECGVGHGGSRGILRVLAGPGVLAPGPSAPSSARGALFGRGVAVTKQWPGVLFLRGEERVRLVADLG